MNPRNPLWKDAHWPVPVARLQPHWQGGAGHLVPAREQQDNVWKKPGVTPENGWFLYFVFKRIKRQVHSTWSGLVGALAPAKRGHIAAATRPHFGGFVLSGPHCSVVYQPQVAAIETWSPSIQLKIAKSQGDLSRGMRERLKWSRMTDTFDQPRGKPRSLWRRVNAWNVSYPFSSRRSINRGLDREKKKLALGQPALQFYEPETILSWSKVQSTAKRAMIFFDRACPLPGICLSQTINCRALMNFLLLVNSPVLHHIHERSLPISHSSQSYSHTHTHAHARTHAHAHAHTHTHACPHGRTLIGWLW